MSSRFVMDQETAVTFSRMCIFCAYVLPKSKINILRVNTQPVMRNIESLWISHGSEENINVKWNCAWMGVCLLAYGSYFSEIILWETKNQTLLSFLGLLGNAFIYSCIVLANLLDPQFGACNFLSFLHHIYVLVLFYSIWTSSFARGSYEFSSVCLNRPSIHPSVTSFSEYWFVTFFFFFFMKLRFSKHLKVMELLFK